MNQRNCCCSTTSTDHELVSMLELARQESVNLLELVKNTFKFTSSSKADGVAKFGAYPCFNYNGIKTDRKAPHAQCCDHLLGEEFHPHVENIGFPYNCVQRVKAWPNGSNVLAQHAASVLPPRCALRVSPKSSFSLRHRARCCAKTLHPVGQGFIGKRFRERRVSVRAVMRDARGILICTCLVYVVVGNFASILLIIIIMLQFKNVMASPNRHVQFWPQF